jgi:DNA ligase-4
LRFPRITKIFRSRERTWQDGINLQDLHKVARDVVGRDRSNKDIDDWNNSIWGKPISPSISRKRKAKADIWEEKLIADDRLRARNQGWTAFDSRVLQAASSICSSPLPLRTRTNVGVSRNSSPASPPLAPNPSTPPPHHKARLPSVYPSPISSPLAVQPPNKIPSPAISTKDRESISDVLSKSLVFVAAQNPISRERWKLKVPPERIVHSLEALFIACGWDSGVPPSPWVRRGIIVLDVDESTVHKTNILNAMNERRAACIHQSNRASICMLERNMLD